MEDQNKRGRPEEQREMTRREEGGEKGEDQRVTIIALYWHHVRTYGGCAHGRDEVFVNNRD